MTAAIQKLPSPPPSSRKSMARKRLSPKSSYLKRRASDKSDVFEPDRMPTQLELDVCADLPILDMNGNEMPFKSLYNRNQRHLVIFVRHFFCGMCQDYIRQLASLISPDDLANLSPPTQLSIIGCGSPDLISDYSSYTEDCPFPIYADHTRQLYYALDMTSTLDQGPTRPAYQTSNFAGMIARNMWQVISSGTSAVKGGNFSQLGGEMLFEDGKLVWCHRMQNTRNHTEVADVKKLLGL